MDGCEEGRANGLAKPRNAAPFFFFFEDFTQRPECEYMAIAQRNIRDTRGEVESLAWVHTHRHTCI